MVNILKTFALANQLLQKEIINLKTGIDPIEKHHNLSDIG